MGKQYQTRDAEASMAGLVDALAELVTGLRHGRMGRGLGVGGALLEVVEVG